MIIFVDTEGDPVQEFSALYVDPISEKIVDVFHRHVCYPLRRDKDSYARHHVHGLCRMFLRKNGLQSVEELKKTFNEWLQSHPFTTIYANAPDRENSFLSLIIVNVSLNPWKERVNKMSHKVALFMKKNQIPVCQTVCHAHKCFVGWRPKNSNMLSETDAAKMSFSFHCSLYDCIECCIFHFRGE